VKKKPQQRKVPPIIQKAERALRIAVAKAIKEHRKSGDPIVVWERGKVVSIPANRL